MKKVLTAVLLMGIAFSASSSNEKFAASASLQTNFIDGFPYSYQCGYFYNDDYANGLPAGTALWVFSDVNDHSAVIAVGYYDSNYNPVTIYLSGSFDLENNFANLFTSYGTVSVTLSNY